VVIAPILRRMRQRPFVLEHLAEIAAIDPATTGRTADEMLCVALGRVAHSSPEDGATVNHLPAHQRI
jgi:hypothetical protein